MNCSLRVLVLSMACGLALVPAVQAQQPQQQPAAGATAARVETTAAAVGKGEPVVAGGQVPDEATRAAVIEALRRIYGPSGVIDKIEVVSTVSMPANWAANVQRLITPSLKDIHRGQFQIEGTQMALSGEVGNEALRQKIVSDMANALNPTYTIKNSLRVPVSEQIAVDQVLGNRTIEFELGSATLTSKGRAILDEMAPILQKLTNKSVAVVGHTDNAGNRTSNLALSQSRAESVKGYLVGKGIDPMTLTTSGVGPDQPVASNATDEGRSRNRRIEFRVGR
ncbi:cell envelope biogenesis protein OmpA [Variovorax sp. RO1]|uniref:OmpA family protein n=1 Tax=unclassified Variovorax TaxID=663243 RepID=UPI000C717F6B|nr:MULTISPECIES: OmpA family protein [Variovorax]PLC01420.1 cell envelope biogenesis protein OmpA [Variovorax sp. RO1]WPG37515.1 OmpA family protein [Variovorax boronicumulans]